jgi:hypothetical protein
MDIVSFETAKAQKEAGRTSPAPAPGQHWYFLGGPEVQIPDGRFPAGTLVRIAKWAKNDSFWTDIISPEQYHTGIQIWPNEFYSSFAFAAET